MLALEFFRSTWRARGKESVSERFSALLPLMCIQNYNRHQTWVSCVSCIGGQILYHCAPWEAHLKHQRLEYILGMNEARGDVSVKGERMWKERISLFV